MIDQRTQEAPTTAQKYYILTMAHELKQVVVIPGTRAEATEQIRRLEKLTGRR